MNIPWPVVSQYFHFYSPSYSDCSAQPLRAEEHVLLQRPMTASWSSAVPYGFPGSLIQTAGFAKDFSNHPAARVILPYPGFSEPYSTTIGSVTPYYASLCLSSARKPAPWPSTASEDSSTLLEVRIEAFFVIVVLSTEKRLHG